MYCTKCGNKNDDGSSFCGNCGAALINNDINNSAYSGSDMNNQYNSNSQNANTYYNPPQNGYYNQAPNNPSSKINSMALAGFIVSFFFGLIGLILSLIGFHQTRVRGERGKGFAIAGIVIGCLSVISTIWLIIFVVTAEPYELHNFYNNYYYYNNGYGTAAVKQLLSMFK